MLAGNRLLIKNFKAGMADKKEKTFRFVVVGGGIAGVTCVEQVK